MWSEFSPAWGGARMSKSQVKKYIKDMKEAQRIAKMNLEIAKKNWVFKNEEAKVKELEKLLEEDNLYS